MTEAVTKTIIGSCQEISEKNGWTTFHINDGREWPTKLATKLEKIVEEGRAVGTETATWTFKERESEEINERSGKPFVNRYLDKVEPATDGQAERAAVNTASVSPAPQRAQSGTHEPLPVGDRERVINRLAILKAAAALYAGKGATMRGEPTDDLPVWTDEAVLLTLAAATHMETWVVRDVTDLPF